jgi:hypothetical protein
MKPNTDSQLPIDNGPRSTDGHRKGYWEDQGYEWFGGL